MGRARTLWVFPTILFWSKTLPKRRTTYAIEIEDPNCRKCLNYNLISYSVTRRSIWRLGRLNSTFHQIRGSFYIAWIIYCCTLDIRSQRNNLLCSGNREIVPSDLTRERENWSSFHRIFSKNTSLKYPLMTFHRLSYVVHVFKPQNFFSFRLDAWKEYLQVLLFAIVQTTYFIMVLLMSTYSHIQA